MDSFLIFDCDGVLVDSEALAIEVMLEALKPYGFQQDMDYWSQTYSGLLGEDILLALQADHGLELPPDFFEVTQADMEQAFAQRLCPISGMPELIRGLPQIPAVVSNSQLAHVQRCVALAGLDAVFGDRLFSSAQVPNPKPAPDVYEFAVGQLGLSKAQVWVVEDSVTGVVSATSAGLRVIGFLGASHISAGHAEKVRAAGALHTAADAGALHRLLQELL